MQRFFSIYVFHTMLLAMNVILGGPLHDAAKTGNLVILDQLLKHTSVNQPDHEGKTALHRAAMEGHLNAVHTLLQYNPDLRILDKYGNNVCLWAAGGGHDDIVRILLDRGVPANQINGDGHTALYYAAEYGHNSTVQLLLSRGAHIIAALDGRTPIDMARANGHENIVHLLQEPLPPAQPEVQSGTPDVAQLLARIVQLEARVTGVEDGQYEESDDDDDCEEDDDDDEEAGRA